MEMSKDGKEILVRKAIGVSLQGMTGLYILLSTKKWNNCYMYMQNWLNGDVQGTADPNEQAHFILSCDVQLKRGTAQWYVIDQSTE